MRSTQLITAAWLSLTVLFACASAADGPPPTPYEQRVLDIRKALMADPAAAMKDAKTLEKSAQGEPNGMAAALWLQGEALARLGRPEEAIPVLARARRNLISQDGVLAGDILLGEGRAARNLGRQGLALASFQDAYRAYELGNDDRKQAIALHAIGTLYTNARRWDRALDVFDQSEAMATAEGQLRFAILNDKSRVYTEQGEMDLALETAQETLRLAEVIDKPYPRANSHILLADILIDHGKLESARSSLEKARAFDTDPNASIWRPFLLMIEGRLANETGDLETASKRFGALFESYDMDAPVGDYRRAHRLAAEHYGSIGDHALAFAHMTVFADLDSKENGAAAANSFDLSQAAFEAKNRDLEIERLKIEKLKVEAEATKTRHDAEAAVAAKEARFRALITTFALAGASILVGVLLMWLRSARRAQERLVRTNADLVEAMEARQRFLASTSHEIRTPLNGVIPFAELILDRDDEKNPDDASKLDAETRGMLQQIVRSGTLLKSIVDDILDVAKMEEGNFEVSIAETDVGLAVADGAEHHRGKATKKGVDLIIDTPATLASYETDQRLIQQCVANLVGNAVKFTESGKVIVAVIARGDGFDITVQDTGIGIPADKVERVFEDFTQVDEGANRQYGGTGLGLALVRRFSELLGGKVWCESTLGVGTKFTLRINAASIAKDDPASSEPERSGAPVGGLRAVPRSDTGEVDLSKLRVLVAEDNKVNQMLLTTMLANVVARLDIVENGHDAVQHAYEKECDLILMDNQMPGMSGLEATVAIRGLANVKSLPIIAVTADVATSEVKKLLEAGVDDVVEKPVQREKLLTSITRRFDPVAEVKKAVDAG